MLNARFLRPNDELKRVSVFCFEGVNPLFSNFRSLAALYIQTSDQNAFRLRLCALRLVLPNSRDSLSNKFIVKFPPLVLYLTFRLGIIFIFIR